MKLTCLQVEGVSSFTSVAVSGAGRIRIFEKLGTEGCLLDCEVWASREIKQTRPAPGAANPAKKYEKGKDDKKDAKAFLQNQQQAKQTIEKRVPRFQRKLKRDPFKFKDVRISAAHGCGSCQLFADLLETLLSTGSAGDVEELEFEWVGYDFFLKAQHVQAQRSFSFQFFSPTGASSVIHGLRSANILSGDTASASSFALAEGWIRECETSHAQCGSGRVAPLPKRCLDLEPLGRSDRLDIRLAETEGITGTYACLSHCWGKGVKPIQTTTETIKNHFNGIPSTALPKTFGDAVAITRRLGLRYLWIDSLCIIQDSAKDWQIESSKMADIYHQSFITIAAISSPDSRGGCFSPHKLGDSCFQVQGDGFETLIAARSFEGDGQVSSIQAFGEAFPALTRAWIYQERMLSRRILYCTSREFQFECRADTACECGNRSMPPHPLPGTPASQALLQSKEQYAEVEKLHSIRGRYSAEQLCQHWQKSVMHYTKLYLTHSSDKLPALSGCAQDIRRITQDRYLAGLWSSSFAEGMLWIVNGPRNQPPPEARRAPSWSWASVDATQGIQYIYPLMTRFRQTFQDRIKAVECVPVGDSTGAVKPGGYVRLQASLCPAYLRRICRQCRTKGRGTPYIIEHDGWRDMGSSRRKCPSNGLRGIKQSGAAQQLLPDYKYDRGVNLVFQERYDGFFCRDAPVFLLHLYDGQSSSNAVTDYFLVLTRSAVSDGNSYERVALMILEFKNWETRDSWHVDEYQTAVGEETIITIE